MNTNEIKKNLTFGSDPECFVINEEGYNLPPSFFRYHYGVEADKPKSKHPIYNRIKTDNGNIIVMEDGAAFELTIPPVEFGEHNLMYDYVQTGYNWIKELGETFGHKFYPKPTVNFDLGILAKDEKEEEFYHLSCIFGCDKDWDAFDQKFEGTQFSVSEYKYRHAGGHFVIGMKDKEILEMMHKSARPFVQICAFLIGAKSLLESPYPEEEKQRQSYYGKPGKYRPPKYGIEYRSPSVSWTMNKNLYEYFQWASLKAVELFLNPKKTIGLLKEYTPPLLEAYKKVDYSTLQELHNIFMEA